MAKQWYVVHAYSNFEGKVKASLQEHGAFGRHGRFFR